MQLGLLQLGLVVQLGLIGVTRAQFSGKSTWSPWQVKYTGLQCRDLQPAPFAGLKAHWPKCWQAAVESAATIASSRNCRLCDLVFSGSKPQELQSWVSQGCDVQVTCSSEHSDSLATCGEGHGHVFGVLGLNDAQGTRQSYPSASCKPCPTGCKYCYDDSSFFTGTDVTQFQCIMEAVGSPTEPGGERCETPAGYRCDPCHKRSCGVVVNLDLWCDENDYQAVCDFPTEYDDVAPEVPVGKTKETPGALDYTLTIHAGDDKTQPAPVYKYLMGDWDSTAPLSTAQIV